MPPGISNISNVGSSKYNHNKPLTHLLVVTFFLLSEIVKILKGDSVL